MTCRKEIIVASMEQKVDRGFPEYPLTSLYAPTDVPVIQSSEETAYCVDKSSFPYDKLGSGIIPDHVEGNRLFFVSIWFN